MKKNISTEIAAQLEREELSIAFDKAVKANKDLFDAKKAAVDIAIKDLVALSEKTGIPFDLEHETYLPSSLKTIFKNIHHADIYKFANISYMPMYERAGWVNSSDTC